MVLVAVLSPLLSVDELPEPVVDVLAPAALTVLSPDELVLEAAPELAELVEAAELLPEVLPVSDGLEAPADVDVLSFEAGA